MGGVEPEPVVNVFILWWNLQDRSLQSGLPLCEFKQHAAEELYFKTTNQLNGDGRRKVDVHIFHWVSENFGNSQISLQASSFLHATILQTLLCLEGVNFHPSIFFCLSVVRLWWQ